MASKLAMATERLIEAALGEVSVNLSAAAKDGVAELRHIHSSTDKLLEAEIATQAKLDQIQQALDSKLEVAMGCAFSKLEAAISSAIGAQTRTLSLHAAIDRVNSGNYSYDNHARNMPGGTELTKDVLRNALKGQASWLPDNAVYTDSSNTDSYGRPRETQHGFRTAYSSYLHGLTGLEPTLEVSADGKRCSIRL